MRRWRAIWVAGVVVASAGLCPAEDVTVVDSAELRRAAAAAGPGDRITLAAGRYAPVYLQNLHGAPDAPVVIEAADPNHPPVFEGGQTGLQISGFSHVVLRNLRVVGASGNGVNLDDGGDVDTPSHHLVLEGLVVEDIGPEGNCDAIKLSGVTDFVVRDCRASGWGGQAVDLVGCHRGVIEDCRFVGKPSFSQHTGPQFKGGTSQVTLRRCELVDAGMRAVNVGGSTGLEFFRPRDARYEARDITVEQCTIRGSMAALAFVGVDGAVAQDNRIEFPTKWLVRILQETREPGFAACRNVRLEGNEFTWNDADCPVPINIGDATAPETFEWVANRWRCVDRPERGTPQLPGRVRPND